MPYNYKHTLFLSCSGDSNIPCSEIEKSAKSETSNFGLHFLNAASKNVKSRVFLDFQKKRKIRILELWVMSVSASN